MRLNEFLGVELPIIQAPMAGVQDHTLSLAVAAAGGLGSLPCAVLSNSTLQSELDVIKAKTDKPININFFCHQAPVFDQDREAQWRQLLAPYFKEYGINPEEVPVGQARVPFSHELVDILEPYKPPIVSFHFGLPTPDLVARVKGWGARVLSTATTVKEALWLEAHGVDGIIAQGVEAGGHRGMFLSTDITTQVGTLSLLPQIIRKVNLPVIAAGGIADAAGIRAVLSLGAVAAQVGTAYLLCAETNTSQLHRDALKSSEATHTALTNLFTGRPARSIVNRVIREIGPMSNSLPDFPLAAASITALRKKAEADGAGDFSPLWSGQNATGCEEISATALTIKLAADVYRGKNRM